MKKQILQLASLLAIVAAALFTGCWGPDLFDMRSDKNMFASAFNKGVGDTIQNDGQGHTTLTLPYPMPNGETVTLNADIPKGSVISDTKKDGEGNYVITLGDGTVITAKEFTEFFTITDNGDKTSTVKDHEGNDVVLVATSDVANIHSTLKITAVTINGDDIAIYLTNGKIINTFKLDPNGVKGVTATQGEYADKVYVYWTPKADPNANQGYTYYVYRAPIDDPGNMECLNQKDANGEPIGITEADIRAADARSNPYNVTEIAGPAVYISNVDLSGGVKIGLGTGTLYASFDITVDGRKYEKFRGVEGYWFHKTVYRSTLITAINKQYGYTVAEPVNDGDKLFIKITSHLSDIKIEDRFQGGDALGNKVKWFFDSSGGPVEVARPTKQVTVYPDLYYLSDTTAKSGTRYIYKVRYKKNNNESGFNSSCEGYKKDSLKLVASDGISYDEVELSMDGSLPVHHYKLERSYWEFNKSSLRFTHKDEVLNDNWDGTRTVDTPPIGAITYKVTPYDAAGNEITQDSEGNPLPASALTDIGYRLITDIEFFIEFDNQMQMALDKIQLMHASGTGKLGSEDTYGEISGKCEYRGKLSGLSGDVNITFFDYSDAYIVFNGTNHTLSSTSSGNNDGTVTTSGIYPGYVRYAIVIKDQAPAGGYYYISQNGGPETEIHWDYRAKTGL